MQNFIVLGIIPGTNIQTTFNFWLVVALGFSILLNVYRLATLLGHVQTYLAAREIARTINHFDLITI